MTETAPSARRTSLLAYQLRYEREIEPETLFAEDITDAMRQMRHRVLDQKVAIALWRDGALIAECRPPDGSVVGTCPSDLRDQLAKAGFYIFGDPDGKTASATGLRRTT